MISSAHLLVRQRDELAQLVAPPVDGRSSGCLVETDEEEQADQTYVEEK
jgi:hypothetical protein